MTPTELKQILADVATERLALLGRHEAAARAVGHYDFNNTYQYVINREETHVTWLREALEGFGAALPSEVPGVAVPAPAGRKRDPGIYRTILEEDARSLGAFVERWRPRVAALTDARHRTMLNVILGESLEHRRLFEQAAAGVEDLLGRRTGGVTRVGAVLPNRWQE